MVMNAKENYTIPLIIVKSNINPLLFKYNWSESLTKCKGHKDVIVNSHSRSSSYGQFFFFFSGPPASFFLSGFDVYFLLVDQSYAGGAASF